MVEINEKWACPSARTVAAMARRGRPVVAGSDSHHCRDVGVYRSVRLTAGAGVRADGPGALTGMEHVLIVGGEWVLIVVVFAGAVPEVAASLAVPAGGVPSLAQPLRRRASRSSPGPRC